MLNLPPTVQTPRNILAVAASLVSEDGENSEYDRAIVELTCTLLGLPTDDNRDGMLYTLRLLNRV